MAREHVGPGGIRASNIRGFEKVIANLNREILAIIEGSRGGMIRAAKFIRRDMEVTYPVIPRDTGNLRGSWQVHSVYEGKLGHRKYGIRMGFGANYALWVHEMVDADFTSPRWRTDKKTKLRYWYTPIPNAGPKFFEEALNRNHDTILQLIADGIKPLIK